MGGGDDGGGGGSGTHVIGEKTPLWHIPLLLSPSGVNPRLHDWVHVSPCLMEALQSGPFVPFVGGVMVVHGGDVEYVLLANSQDEWSVFGTHTIWSSMGVPLLD